MKTAPRTRTAEKEKAFFENLSLPFREALLGKESFENKLSAGKVTTDVDQSVHLDGGRKTLLIEFSTENYSKLLPGQYALINASLTAEGRTRYHFLVVHDHATFNPERTMIGLEVINQKLLNGEGIPFSVVSAQEFRETMAKYPDWDTLCAALSGQRSS